MKISFSPFKMPENGTLVLGVLENKKFLPLTEQVDKDLNGLITKAINCNRFEGNNGETLELITPTNTALSRILLVGMGNPKDMCETQVENLGGSIYAALAMKGDENATTAIGSIDCPHFKDETFATCLARGIQYRSYRFDKYRTTIKENKKPSLKQVNILTKEPDAAQNLYTQSKGIVEAVAFTKDLVAEPANILHPESYAARVKELSTLGLKVKALGVKEMTALGMHALVGVGLGSAIETQLVVLEWNGSSNPKDDPIAFIGKGVTFDTGGISLKPGAGMDEMKWDMAGSATVVGTMIALAKRKAKVNAIGLIGLVENMPSSKAQRPGDVVKSMSGQTIEVLNTDAEGRLVLCDVLTYCQTQYKPKCMIDLATLTGAMIIALGHEYAGIFANNDELADQLIAAGKKTEEKLWRMPMEKAYDKAIDSPIADMQNISNDRAAGSIIGAQFLNRFVNKDIPWAHLDIAGVAWTKKDMPLSAKGATAFGVRLLDKFVSETYEQ
ncbi:MAG: leucyl aminopeptidase [Alphaproteobacteria bacterium]|nr:leucyl aminopeptidase [Alphaproteobacteria bacterium]